MMMWAYGFGWFGWLMMLAWWALVVVGIVWLVRTVSGSGRRWHRLERSSDPRRSVRLR